MSSKPCFPPQRPSPRVLRANRRRRGLSERSPSPLKKQQMVKPSQALRMRVILRTRASVRGGNLPAWVARWANLHSNFVNRFYSITILFWQKPKYSLHGDDGDNEADEDFDNDKYSDDDSDDEDIEFDEGSSRKRKRPALPAGPRPRVVVPKDRINFYGAVPGIEIGKIWETRMACCADGVQRPPVAGIHGGKHLLLNNLHNRLN